MTNFLCLLNTDFSHKSPYFYWVWESFFNIFFKMCQNRRRQIRKIPPSIIFLLHFGQIFRPYLSRSMRSLSGEMVVVFSKNVDNFTAVAVLSEFTDCWLQKMNKWLIMHLMVMGTGWLYPKNGHHLLLERSELNHPVYVHTRVCWICLVVYQASDIRWLVVIDWRMTIYVDATRGFYSQGTFLDVGKFIWFIYSNNPLAGFQPLINLRGWVKWAAFLSVKITNESLITHTRLQSWIFF